MAGNDRLEYGRARLLPAPFRVQAVHPENIRDGAPYDNPEFEQLVRDLGA